MEDPVFISYVNEDKATKDKILKRLQDQGINVWVDKQNLKGGEPWSFSILETIKKCSCFILLLSETAVKKDSFIKQEILEAIKIQEQSPFSVFIIPVKIEDCTIPYPELNDLHFINYYADQVAAMDALFGAILTSQKKKFNNIEIIGFDFGHGETSVAVTNSDATGEPKSLEILSERKSIISAVSFVDGKGVLIGDDTLLYSGSEYLGIMLKTKHLSSDTKFIEIFIKQCLNILEASNKIKNDEESHFIVGFPAGWGKTARDDYKQLFIKAGVKSKYISLIPEARAAFLDASESGDIGNLDPKSSRDILIIDIGSLTTDFTLVKNMTSTIVDTSNNILGSGLIDEQIFLYVLKNSTEGDAREFDRIFNLEKTTKARCVLACRRAKEKYFNENEDFWEGRFVRESCDFDESDLVFRVKLTSQDMKNILKTKIPVLHNQPWDESLENSLQHIKTKISVIPSLIIMTGGGSCMSFTQDVAKKVFPKSRVLVSGHPSLSVSRGLAYAGRKDIRILRFRDEVQFLVKGSKKLDKIIEVCMIALIDSITKALSPIFVEIISKVLIELRNRRIKDYVSECKRLTNQYTESDEFKQTYAQIFLEWLNDCLNIEIVKETDKVCRKYGIMTGSIIIIAPPEDLVIENLSKLDTLDAVNVISGIIAIIAGVIFVAVAIVISFLLPFIMVGVVIVSLFSKDKPTDNEQKKEAESSVEKEAENSLSTIQLWLIRNLAFRSDESVYSIIKKKEGKISEEIKGQLKEKLFSDENISKIKDPIKQMLLDAAEKASLLVK